MKRTKTIRMNPELIEKLEVLATKENRNFNNLVETILMKAVTCPDLVLSFKG
jgi:predicted HicB family RNase H-like nuclease